MRYMEGYEFQSALEASENEIRQFKNAFTDNGESGINGSCGLMRYDDPNDWLDYVARVTKGNEPGRARSTVLFLKRSVDNRIVGIMDIRHGLADSQRQNGHVGMSLVPSERGKGLAGMALDYSFGFLRELGVDAAVVTCDEDNLSSRKAIERCGLAFDGTLTEAHGNVIRLYSKKL